MQQADVRERLREVTEQALSDRIVFLAEESDVVLERAQLPEMRSASSIHPAIAGRDQPARADEECRFAPGQSVDPLLG